MQVTFWVDNINYVDGHYKGRLAPEVAGTTSDGLLLEAVPEELVDPIILCAYNIIIILYYYKSNV